MKHVFFPPKNTEAIIVDTEMRMITNLFYIAVVREIKKGG